MPIRTFKMTEEDPFFMMVLEQVRLNPDAIICIPCPNQYLYERTLCYNLLRCVVKNYSHSLEKLFLELIKMKQYISCENDNMNLLYLLTVPYPSAYVSICTATTLIMSLFELNIFSDNDINRDLPRIICRTMKHLRSIDTNSSWKSFIERNIQSSEEFAEQLFCASIHELVFIINGIDRQVKEVTATDQLILKFSRIHRFCVYLYEKGVKLSTEHWGC